MAGETHQVTPEATTLFWPTLIPGRVAWRLARACQPGADLQKAARAGRDSSCWMESLFRAAPLFLSLFLQLPFLAYVSSSSPLSSSSSSLCPECPFLRPRILFFVSFLPKRRGTWPFPMRPGEGEGILEPGTWACQRKRERGSDVTTKPGRASVLTMTGFDVVPLPDERASRG